MGSLCAKACHSGFPLVLLVLAACSGEAPVGAQAAAGAMFEPQATDAGFVPNVIDADEAGYERDGASDGGAATDAVVSRLSPTDSRPFDAWAGCAAGAERRAPMPTESWQRALPQPRSVSANVDPPLRGPAPLVELADRDRVGYASVEQRPPMNNMGQGTRAYLHDMHEGSTRMLTPAIAAYVGNQALVGLSQDASLALLRNSFPELPSALPSVALLDIDAGVAEPLPPWCAEDSTQWPAPVRPDALSRDGTRVLHSSPGLVTVCDLDTETRFDAPGFQVAFSPDLRWTALDAQRRDQHVRMTLHEVDTQESRVLEMAMPPTHRQGRIVLSNVRRFGINVAPDAPLAGSAEAEEPVAPEIADACAVAQVFDVHEDGLSEDLLTPFDLSASYLDVVIYDLSDDGRRALLTGFRPDATSDVLVVDFERREWVIVMSPEAPFDRCFGNVLSPQGTSVALHCCDDDDGSGCEIWLRDL